MRVTSLVLGVLGGVVGLSGGSLAVQTGAQLNALSRFFGESGLERAFGAQQLIGVGTLAVLVSVLGVVGAGLALGRPIAASVLMLSAALGGLLLIRADYLLAAALLVAASILSLLAPRAREPASSQLPTPVAGETVVAARPTAAPPAALEAPGTVVGASRPISSWLARAAWGLGTLLLVVTWWFWVLALFARLILAAFAWIPRYGRGILAASGWNQLPLVAGIRGWRASGLLLLLAITVLFVGAYLAPRVPTT